MNESTNDRIAGKFHEVEGKIKETVGHAANNPELESEGQAENLGGKIRKTVGEVEKIFEK